MVDVAVTTSRLRPKISALFNNPVFSDVEFVFSNAGYSEKLFGHKLILAVRSTFFAQMFYKGEDTVTRIPLPFSQKESFEKLVKYFYTDELHFHTFEEANDLLELARIYGDQDLIDECDKFILEDKLTVDNLFPKYEIALKKNLIKLLEQCRNLVCSKTQVILDSEGFTKTSSAVIMDIVKLENLSIYSELEIITAVLNWGKEDIKNKKTDSDNQLLRKAISPFMKDLRFLTLTFAEFEYFLDHYDIFSGREISLLTRKILQPQSNDNLPEDICQIVRKRRNKSLSLSSSDLNPEEFVQDKLEYKVKNCTLMEEKEKKLSFIEKVNKVSSTNLKENKFCSSPSISKYFRQGTPSQPSSVRSFIRDSKPFHQVTPGSNYNHGSYRLYSFPLEDFSDYFQSSFRSDITCSVNFNLKSGNLWLSGFQLKIQNKNKTPEKLEVFVNLNGFSKMCFKENYQKELCNDILTVQFRQPMRLQEGCKGNLEVSLENIFLNRCCICKLENSLCVLNNGLTFSLELSLNSQKNVPGGFYFIIDKLLYKI